MQVNCRPSVPPVSPCRACSDRFHRVLWPNPWPTHRELMTTRANPGGVEQEPRACRSSRAKEPSRPLSASDGSAAPTGLSSERKTPLPLDPPSHVGAITAIMGSVASTVTAVPTSRPCVGRAWFAVRRLERKAEGSAMPLSRGPPAPHASAVPRESGSDLQPRTTPHRRYGQGHRPTPPGLPSTRPVTTIACRNCREPFPVYR